MGGRQLLSGKGREGGPVGVAPGEARKQSPWEKGVGREERGSHGTVKVPAVVA